MKLKQFFVMLFCVSFLDAMDRRLTSRERFFNRVEIWEKKKQYYQSQQVLLKLKLLEINDAMDGQQSISDLLENKSLSAPQTKFQAQARMIQFALDVNRHNANLACRAYVRGLAEDMKA